jgi:hypothetical protein
MNEMNEFTILTIMYSLFWFQIVFLMNVVNIIGMFLIIMYMAYGMTSLPLGMIRGRNAVLIERASVEEQVNVE